MKLIPICELDGSALDWAVAKCLGFKPFSDGISWLIDDNGYKQIPKYSTNWAQGGPIIEREGIDITRHENGWYTWFNYETKAGERAESDGIGNTPLVAAMRCFVASRLGDWLGNVEVPDELLT